MKIHLPCDIKSWMTKSPSNEDICSIFHFKEILFRSRKMFQTTNDITHRTKEIIFIPLYTICAMRRLAQTTLLPDEKYRKISSSSAVHKERWSTSDEIQLNVLPFYLLFSIWYWEFMRLFSYIQYIFVYAHHYHYYSSLTLLPFLQISLRWYFSIHFNGISITSYVRISQISNAESLNLYLHIM